MGDEDLSWLTGPMPRRLESVSPRRNGPVALYEGELGIGGAGVDGLNSQCRDVYRPYSLDLPHVAPSCARGRRGSRGSVVTTPSSASSGGHGIAGRDTSSLTGAAAGRTGTVRPRSARCVEACAEST